MGEQRRWVPRTGLPGPAPSQAWAPRGELPPPSFHPSHLDPHTLPTPPPSPLQGSCWQVGNSSSAFHLQDIWGVWLPLALTQAAPRNPTNPRAFSWHPQASGASLSPGQTVPGSAERLLEVTGLLQPDRARGPEDSVDTPSPEPCSTSLRHRSAAAWPRSQLPKPPGRMRPVEVEVSVSPPPRAQPLWRGARSWHRTSSPSRITPSPDLRAQPSSGAEVQGMCS